MPFVFRWISRSIATVVLARVGRYLRSPQGRAMVSRNLNRMRRRG